jgi:hypothetical protein
MKKLLLIILVPTFIIIGIPAIILGIMHDGGTKDALPTELYTDDVNAEHMLYEELSIALDASKNDIEKDFNLEISEDLLNTLIFNSIRGDAENPGINPDYLPTDTCSDSSCLYIMEEDVGFGTARLLGIWIDLEDDNITANVALEVETSVLTYNTALKVDLAFVDDGENGEYRLELDRIRLGNLPIPKGILSAIINTFDGIDVSNALPFGTFDTSDFVYTLEKSDMVAYIEEGNETDGTIQLAAQVLGVVFEEEMLVFDIETDAITIFFELSTLRNGPDKEIPTYLHEMQSAETIDETVFDYNTHLENRFEQFIFNMALTNQSYFTITEQTFNKIVYYEMDGFRDAQKTFEYEDGSGTPQTITIGLEAILFEFRTGDNGVYINVKGLFNIDGIKSQLLIRADDTDQSTDQVYVLEFTEVTLGEEPSKEYLEIVELEAFKEAMKAMGEFPFGSVNDNGDLEIDTSLLTELLEEGSAAGTVSIDQVEIVTEGLRVHVTATDAQLQQLLDDFGDAMNDAFTDPNLLTNLDSILDTSTEGPEQDLYNEVESIQETIDQGGTVTEEDVDAMFEYYDQLDETSQGAFMDTFGDTMDQTLLDAFSDEYNW